MFTFWHMVSTSILGQHQSTHPWSRNDFIVSVGTYHGPSHGLWTASRGSLGRGDLGYETAPVNNPGFYPAPRPTSKYDGSARQKLKNWTEYHGPGSIYSFNNVCLILYYGKLCVVFGFNWHVIFFVLYRGGQKLDRKWWRRSGDICYER